MSQPRDQKRFTISEVAADWHELMIPQRTMRPSIAHDSKQWTRGLQLADMPPPQSATLGAELLLSSGLAGSQIRDLSVPNPTP